MSITPELVISELVKLKVIPVGGKFEITDAILYTYVSVYKKLSNGTNIGSSSNIKFARRLAGLNLLKENVSRGVSAREIKAGHVYLISNPAFPDFYKVGASYDCHSRLNSYQTYSPHRDYKLEKYDFVLNKFLVEKQILNHPLISKATGEWVSISNAKLIFDDISRYNSTMYSGLW